MEGPEQAGPSSFSALLRRYRLAAGLSQEALAQRARLSVQGISALERGYRRSPQRNTLALLASALTLDSEQRQAFEAAAFRPTSPRDRRRTSVTVGPWPSTQNENLPLSLSEFIGRNTELYEIGALVAEHRFVTITGAGGIGKTQTALRVAAASSDSATRVVCFVGLAPMNDPSLVTTAIAAALDLQEVPNHPLLETVQAFLKCKTMFLVLDNCEHVIGEAATVAESLLRGCPNLRILATSREPLRAAGERTYRLPSLDNSDAVALFADRAQAADAHFMLTDENRRAVGEICARLGGIPLAIELAAARVSIVPVTMLTKELGDRFAVLVDGERTAPPRQKTVHAAIDWSYELLSESERRLFERLSVFAGGCTIEAAKAVCSGKDVAEADVGPLISSLVSKSLVLVDLERDEPRYRLLVPFREYADKKLRASGDGDAVAHRHVLALIELARRFARREQHYSVYYAHPREEIENWRAGVTWALTERKDVVAGQRLVAEVFCLWGGTSHVLSEGKRWISASLDLVDERTPSSVTAKLKLAEAYLASHCENYRLQLASAEEAAVYYREVGDELSFVRAQTLVGNALMDLRREPGDGRDWIDMARKIFEEALLLARKLGSQWDTTFILRNLSVCLNDRNLAASRTYLAEALKLIEAADDQYAFELAALDHAALTFREGDPESALQHLTDVFAKDRILATSRPTAAAAQRDIAEYLIALGRYEEAREYASKALGAAREEHLDALTADCLGRLVKIAALRKTRGVSDAQIRAARTLGFVDARLGALGSSTLFGRSRAVAALRRALGAEALADLMTEGATMTEDEAVEAALKF